MAENTCQTEERSREGCKRVGNERSRLHWFASIVPPESDCPSFVQKMAIFPIHRQKGGSHGIFWFSFTPLLETSSSDPPERPPVLKRL
jgi:hypothetical protein